MKVRYLTKKWRQKEKTILIGTSGCQAISKEDRIAATNVYRFGSFMDFPDDPYPPGLIQHRTSLQSLDGRIQTEFGSRFS